MTNHDGHQLGAEAAHRLARLGCCTIEQGLSDAEFDEIEGLYGFQFAEDHRDFLSVGLPVSSPPREGASWNNPWPDWRNGGPDLLRKHLSWPERGVAREIEIGLWKPEWGLRPADPEAAISLSRNLLKEAPRLAPVYGHRFLPAGPGYARHPILSIWGTDIVPYGENLIAYVGNEFDEESETPQYDARPQVTVTFWRDFIL
ncbi:hypothetical protein OG689_43370 [Kitasatospora sp. NBC_00240]|uniref:hypothetical protein n=1 Tax=Kitasatospora sp. NBC_00240 TaxID=2903567 RepID=UPI00224CE8B4|nr:hypothetical protein [Kitasatospora sp. NBC_00240]MCX5215981.1 hypothetical protein [Kitasatospora sp. NBC_00240]